MWRRLLKRIHPEGIPWPGSVLYNALSRTRIFRQHYRLLAQDISGYCREGSILDVGTGPGRLLLSLHEFCPRARLIGVDISRAMVAKARENLARAGLSDVIQVQVSAAQQLPFGADSFDAVVSTGSVHHWKDPTAAFNDAYRVLRPGGWALMYDLVADTPREVLQNLTREHGRFRVLFLRLHSLEEPFHTVDAFASLAGLTSFKTGQVRFVGALCCLAMQKPADDCRHR